MDESRPLLHRVDDALLDSTGNSMPVGLPKPKALTHLYRPSSPIVMPILTAPTLLDHCRISRTE